MGGEGTAGTILAGQDRWMAAGPHFFSRVGTTHLRVRSIPFFGKVGEKAFFQLGPFVVVSFGPLNSPAEMHFGHTSAMG